MKTLTTILFSLLCIVMLGATAWGQATGDYRSAATGNWNATATWERFDGADWIAAVATPDSSAGVITIRNGHIVTVTATVLVNQVTVDAGGQITINAGFGMTVTNGSGTDLTINGTVLNSGNTLFGSSGPTWVVNDGGTYIHNTTSGISTPMGGATLDTLSNFIYRGSSVLDAAMSLANRTYGNLTVESASGTWTKTLTGTTPLTINGNFNIGGSGGGILSLSQSGASSNVFLNGNFTVVSGCSYTFTTGAITVVGNITNNGTVTTSSTGSFTFNGATLITGNNVTFNNGFTVNSGKTLAISTNGNILAASKTATINGVFQINEGAWTGSNGTFSYGASGSLVFNNTSGNYGPIDNSHLYWPSSNGPANVTIQGAGGINLSIARTVSGVFQTSAQANGAGNLTLDGTAQINTGGYFTGSPTYGGSSTLIYNTGGTFGRGSEWNATSGAGAPASVQVSNSTTINYTAGANSNMILPGNLTIDNGSALYMDYGAPGWDKSLTVAGNVTVNGNLSLGDGVGSDLNLGGNWSYSPGSINFNSRAVTFNGAGTQTITGATTFAYLTVNKASGSVDLNDNITVNNTLTVTAGTMNTGSKKVTLGASGNLSEAGSGVIVIGTVEATRTVGGANETFGGIGLELSPNATPYPGATTITRVTGTAQTGSGNQSIKRSYDVNAATGSGLDLNMVFHYDDAVSELNGRDESKLYLFRSSTSGSTWENGGVSALNTSANTIALNNVADLSIWTASDSANPLITSASSSSDIVTAGGESTTISSLVNDASPLTSSTGAQVWQVTIRDGGGSADADALPTELTAITFSQGSGNTVSDWSNAILAADLFDGTTNIGSGAIGSNTISFSGLSGIQASDGGSKTLALRISLNNPLGSGVEDNHAFVFEVTNSNVTAGSGAVSSQFSSFAAAASDNSKNTIAVIATALAFTTQPSATATNGVALAQQPVVTASDANGNKDFNYFGMVTLTNSQSFSMAGEAVAAISGVVTYSTLAINGTGGVTLSTTNVDGLSNATSDSIFIAGAEPTVQTSGAYISNIGAASATLNWTNGNGERRIVIARSGSAVSTAPTDGISYTANSVFASGDPIGSGYVVYADNGSSVTVTGLTTGTTYHFAVIEYNGTGGSENYLTTGPATANATAGMVQSSASGNWSAPATWIGGVVPISTDNVMIGSGHTITIDDATAQCNNISFGDGTAKLAYSSGSSVLSVYGDFNAASGTHTVFTAWPSGAKLKFTGSAATQTINNLSTSTTSTTQTFFMEVQVDKSSGTVKPAKGDFKFNLGTSLEVINGTFLLDSLSDIQGRNIDGSSATTPTITVQSGATFSVAPGNGSHIGSGTTGSPRPPIGVLTVYGSVDLSTTSTNKINFGNVDIESGGELTLNTGGSTGNFSPGTITIKSGGVLMNLTTTNIWAAGSAVDLQTGGIYKTSTSTTPFPSTLTNNGTVRYQRTASGDQTIADMDYHRLEISFSGNNKVWTLGGTRTIADSLEINNSATLVFAAGSAQTLNQNGTVRLTSGSLDNSDADVTFNLGDGITISRATGTLTTAPTFGPTVNLRYTSTGSDVSTGPEVPVSAATLYNLQVITDTRTVTLSAPATVNGTLTLSNGALDNTSQPLTLADDSYIRRATGTLTSAPTFAGNVNVAYISSIASVTTGAELPTGATELDTLTLDSPMNVTLGAGATVNGQLQLTNGILYLNTNTLTLGANATVSGTPDATHMVVSNGIGSLKKVFSGIGSFTYPLGDTSGTAEYTPATLNFTGGTFDPGATAGVSVTNQRHPGDPSASDYLNRYWSVGQVGISGFSADATYSYTDADIQGNEANIVLGQWDGANWMRYGNANTATNTLEGTFSSFSDFSGIEAGQPVFDANLDSLIFSPIIVNNSSSDTVIVMNNGTDTLTIDSVRVYGGEFSVNPSGSTVLGLAANQKYGVAFNPTSAGVQNAYLVFYSNAASSPDTVFLNGEGVLNNYTVNTAVLGSGSVTKTPNLAQYPEGTNVELTANADAGWHFKFWTGDITGSTNPYMLTVNSNKNVTANFAIDTLAITATAGTNGSITPSGSVKVLYGGSQEFTFTPGSGYHVDSVFVNGVYVDTATTGYVFTDVIAAQTIHVTFAINTYTLSALTVGNGEVLKNPDQATYTHGSNVELTADPEDGWVFDSWSGDASGSVNPLMVTMDANKTITATFVMDSAYLVMYRTLHPDSIYLDVDNAGKRGKSVKAKADKVEFTVTLKPDSNNVNDLHVEFSLSIDTTFEFTVTPAPDSMSPVAKSTNKKWNIYFPAALDTDDVVTIYGWSKKGSNQKVSSFWWTRNGVMVGKKKSKGSIIVNTLRLPMPNRLNVMEETYKQGVAGGAVPLVIGVAQTNKDSIKKYGWVFLKTAADFYKSLGVTSKTGHNLHDSAAKGFEKVVSGKSFKAMTGKYTSFPPTKRDNILFASLAALKLSIAASALEKTPNGFGELEFEDTTANPLNGLMIKEIAAKADTMMTGYPGRTFENEATYANLNHTIRRILEAFEGAMDTVSFAGVMNTKTTGTKALIDVPFLRANTSVTPAKITPVERATLLPEQYGLQQNYPNPFNPTTTIEFSLPIASTVTLKIYNLLGQEIATVLNHQEMEEGTQMLEFNASSLPSGVYFYRINAESVDEDGIISSFTSIKKMLLMK